VGGWHTRQSPFGDLDHEGPHDCDGIRRTQANADGSQVGKRNGSMSIHVDVARATFLPSRRRDGNVEKVSLLARTDHRSGQCPAAELVHREPNYTPRAYAM
jgi:hypothetical protein